MCLAVPMKIIRLLPENKAIVRKGNVSIEADISLLKNPKIGEFTIIHAGFGLEIIDQETATEQLSAWDTLQQIENDG